MEEVQELVYKLQFVYDKLALKAEGNGETMLIASPSRNLELKKKTSLWLFEISTGCLSTRYFSCSKKVSVLCGYLDGDRRSLVSRDLKASESQIYKHVELQAVNAPLSEHVITIANSTSEEN